MRLRHFAIGFAVINLWPFRLTDLKWLKEEECFSMQLSSDRRPRTLRLAAGHSPVVHSILKPYSSFSGQLKISQLSNPWRYLSPTTNFNHPRKLLHPNSLICKIFSFRLIILLKKSIHQHINSLHIFLCRYQINTNFILSQIVSLFEFARFFFKNWVSFY
jgi:hypothetical protein